MANIYARSTDGNNVDNGSTWALAKATMVGGAGVDAAGDTLWVSQAHAESTASGTATWDIAGTIATPSRFLCGNDGAEPPTALASTATMTFTSTATLVIRGSFYAYGHTISVGSTTTGVNMTLAQTGGREVWENCSFRTGGTGNCSVVIGTQSEVLWRNCTVRFNEGTQQGISVNSETQFHWNGGSAVSGTATPATRALFTVIDGANVLVEGVDFTNFSSSLKLVRVASFNSSSRCTLRNCKLPSGWTTPLIEAALTVPGRVEMFNCDSGATTYRVWIEDFVGTLRDETTLVRSGGASDGTTALAWKLVTNTNANSLMPLKTQEIFVWNDTTGSSKTATIEILRDSATNLKDDEVWIEVQYFGSSSAPFTTSITDSKADVLATAADQTTSSVTWTTTGMSNPNKQSLSVTFTPQLKGFVIAQVFVAKASTTLYVDPLLTIT